MKPNHFDIDHANHDEHMDSFDCLHSFAYFDEHFSSNDNELSVKYCVAVALQSCEKFRYTYDDIKYPKEK